ncbi:hypothetical protein PC128_g26687 [Phytophthora cactorum]|nr:hypothetical protein PC120_g26731 [Phytophthora cactorum]KAG3037133.1 hypothetical protein PC121_g24124 [Phytophthora cactorum]KAG3130740.1 hypothetical protein PC128_g26687 [Phytophthora cactorum]
MVSARAGILTVSGVKLKYDAPSRTCVTFSYCSGWETANKLLYAHVPPSQSIVFFAEDDCAGDPVFTGGVGKTVGNEIGIISECRGGSALVSNASADNNNTAWVYSSSGENSHDGNLSVNWFGSLESGDVSVGDV